LLSNIALGFKKMDHLGVFSLYKRHALLAGIAHHQWQTEA
jgi:hypothetical protein